MGIKCSWGGCWRVPQLCKQEHIVKDNKAKNQVSQVGSCEKTPAHIVEEARM